MASPEAHSVQAVEVATREAVKTVVESVVEAVVDAVVEQPLMARLKKCFGCAS